MSSADKSKPMSSAPFVYNEDGSVAWDKMWTSYCYLAKEGGPPHRDTMLKSKNAGNDLGSEPYKQAVKEILRAYSLLIPYKSFDNKDGWVGIKLLSKGMAKWFSGVINSENVECKQEGKFIFLPVNDDFSLEKEIKNDVTVVGKAYHYWKWHYTDFEKLMVIVFGKDLHRY
jgi:sirohydrochlorin cobaltochelatase